MPGRPKKTHCFSRLSPFFPFPAEFFCFLSVHRILCNIPNNPFNSFLPFSFPSLQVLGSPATEDTEFIKNPKARAFLTGLHKRPKVAWGKLYPKAANAPELLDLLDRLLVSEGTRN